MADLGKMEDSITKLKSFVTPVPKSDDVTDEPTTMDTTPPPIDGETCMHGNSWHSNCSECDDLDDMEIALNEMGNIIDTEPNDKELGKKIRDFYNNWLDLIDGRRKIDVD